MNSELCVYISFHEGNHVDEEAMMTVAVWWWWWWWWQRWMMVLGQYSMVDNGISND